MQKYLKIQYFYLAFIIVWTPINFFIEIDAMGRLKMLFSFLTIALLSIQHKRKYSSAFHDVSMRIMLALIAYMSLNYLFLWTPSNPPIPAERIVKICSLIYPFIILSIIIMEIKMGHANKLFSVLIFAYYCWLLALIFFTIGDVGTSSRLSIQGIDANDYAFGACLILFLLYIKCSHYGMSKFKAIMLSIIPLILIVFAASRTAFGCLVIIISMIFINQVKRMDAKKLMVGISLILIGSIGYMYILDNTKLGERLGTTTEQGKDTNLKTGTFVDILGDRGPFYFFGWMEFEKEPIHGIGLTNFGKNGIWGWYKHSLVLHSEYMVQLCECGIIGFSLFISFLVSIFLKIRKASKPYLSISKPILYCALIIPFFIAFFFWTYDRYYIFIYYGMIIGYTKLAKYKYEKHIISRQ